MKKSPMSSTGERNFEPPKIMDLPLVRSTEHSHTANPLDYLAVASAFGEEHSITSPEVPSGLGKPEKPSKIKAVGKTPRPAKIN